MEDLAACSVFVVSSTFHLFSKWVSQIGFLMMTFFSLILLFSGYMTDINIEL